MVLTRKAEEKKVSFSIEASDATNIMLVGDFNNWDPTSTPLRRNRKENLWKGDLMLRPGRYEYKFVINGNWTTDPRNNNRVWNSFGSENSVIEI